MPHPTVRVLAAALACACLAPALHAADAKPPSAPDRALDIYAAPAQRVDIGGGRHLNLRCSGRGAPTVLLEAGQGMTSMAWRKVQPRVAASMRVCAYDRAGLGFSDPGPLPRSAQAAADDLHALVRAAKLETPLVLVGHSLGSYVVRLYAAAHADEVAALVLVDPVSETLAQDAPEVAAREVKMSEENTDYGRHCAEAARKGELKGDTAAAKACVPPPNPGFSERLNDTLRQRFAGTTFWDAALSEREADAANGAALRALHEHGTKPLLVLAADGSNAWLPPEQRKAADAAYDAGRRRIAATSTHGRVIPVANSSHDIQEDRPDAVVDAILEAGRRPVAGKPPVSR